MAKKNFGKFLALAAVTGAVAAGVSYFLKYRSFHAELDEDFHDFEGDEENFDGTLPHEGEAAQRNYVPLGEKKEDPQSQPAVPAPEGAAAEAMEAEAEKKESCPDASLHTEESSDSAATTIEEDLSME